MTGFRVRSALASVLFALAAAAPGAAVEPVDPPAAEDAFAPQLAALPDGAALTWLERLPADPAAPTAPRRHRLRFARLRGSAWTPPVTLVDSDALFANWADTPGVAAAADGALVAWWLERIGEATYAYGVRLVRSTDGGVTWAPLGWLHDDLSPTEHGFVSMTPAPGGLRAFWLDGRATAEGRPMTLRSALVAAAVAPSELVDEAVCDCCSTAAARAGETALVAYRDRTADEIRDVRVAAVGAGASPRSVAAGADGWLIEGCPVNGPALAVADEAVVVAWFGAPDDRAHVSAALSLDGGASFASPFAIDTERPIGRVALAPLGEGETALAWHARAGDRAEIRLARLTAAGAGAPLALATTSGGRQSGFARLAPLPDGRLLAVWTEAGDAPTRLRAALVALGELPRP